MDALEIMFNANAVAWGDDGTQKMPCSGPKSLCYFLQFCGVYREEGAQTRIEGMYKHLGWVQNRSLTSLDVHMILEMLEGILCVSIRFGQPLRKNGKAVEINFTLNA